MGRKGDMPALQTKAQSTLKSERYGTTNGARLALTLKGVVDDEIVRDTTNVEYTCMQFRAVR